MADEDELDLENGESAKKTKTTSKSSTRERGRPSNEAKTRDLQQTIKEGLEELSKWMGESELGSTLADGAPRMAKVLAARASRHARVERALRILFAQDGPLAILRAFGPFARAVGSKVGAFRERGEDVEYVDAEGYVVDRETGHRLLDESGNFIRGSGNA